jgi:hypothetical protein
MLPILISLYPRFLVIISDLKFLAAFNSITPSLGTGN